MDIPWHLLLFSAGAYTLGAGLKATDLASLAVNAGFNRLGLGDGTPFWVLYLLLTAGMIFSSLVSQSKTMRTLIFIPIAIGTAQRFGFSVLSLAFPVALLIEHVYALPFNSKPAALLYLTDHYSWSDTFKFGIVMLSHRMVDEHPDGRDVPALSRIHAERRVRSLLKDSSPIGVPTPGA